MISSRGCARATLLHVKRDLRVEHCSLLDAGCDLVVNASNPAAALGSGVSRAIFDECGGLALQAELRERLEQDFDGELRADDCLVTSAGASKRVRHVLHVASVAYGKGGTGLTSTSERVRSATEAALKQAANLSTAEAPGRLAFPLLAAGHGGLSAGTSVAAMVAGMKRFFRGQPEAAIGRIVLAVPEREKFEVARARLEQLLVLR